MAGPPKRGSFKADELGELSGFNVHLVPDDTVDGQNPFRQATLTPWHTICGYLQGNH